MLRLIVPAVAAVVLLSAPGASAAGGDEPWRDAQNLEKGIGSSRAELIIGTRESAAERAEGARRAYRGSLRRLIRSVSAAADRELVAALGLAVQSARAGNDNGLAEAQGAATAALMRGSLAAADRALAEGDHEAARQWLLIRDFRTATRFSRPGTGATEAVEQLSEGAVTPTQARLAVRKDLLDSYQARLRELLDDASRGDKQGFSTRRLEAAARARGYFEILAPRYREVRGPEQLRQARKEFSRLLATAGEGGAGFRAATTAASRSLSGFTAAPFGPGEAARRAQQLLRFLALVPVEYSRGVSDGKVTKDFEIEEAVTFQAGAKEAFSDLESDLARRNPAQAKAAGAELTRLSEQLNQAQLTPGAAPATSAVEAAADSADKALRASMPAAWLKPTDESDYDLIAMTLDRMEAAAGAGQYEQAEQARLEAYAFFEFGPERRLQSFDPALATEVESYFWFGAGGKEGLATLIADRAPARKIKETRRDLNESLSEAAATLGDSANKATVVTNSAIIVFREGLEAVMILAAITASFVGARRKMRRPVLIGAGLGLLASVVTWILAQTLLTSLEQYGEKLEAIVGIIAIGVLLLITNWFFHRVYWSEWIGKFHRQRKRLEKLDQAGISFLSAQVIGLALLGLTSVYREGFETVLFLQSLQLSAGTLAVLEGAGLGLALTFAVGATIFVLERKLPYKKMLIVTGVFIGFVLVVMVGQTARTMQGAGWLPITSVGVDVPSWAGLWFGVFPTVETLLAQVAAATFVIGSYFLAQEMKVKAPRRRAARQEAEGGEPTATPPTPAAPLTAVASSQGRERRPAPSTGRSDARVGGVESNSEKALR